MKAYRSLEEVRSIAQSIEAILAPASERIMVVGSVRRERPQIGDLEFLIIPAPAPRPVFGQRLAKNAVDRIIQDWFANGTATKIADGPRLKRFQYWPAGGFQIEIFLVTEITWALQAVIRTGPDTFSKRVVTNKGRGGLLPAEYEWLRGQTEIMRRKDKAKMFLADEKAVFSLLGIPYLEPKDR